MESPTFPGRFTVTDWKSAQTTFGYDVNSNLTTQTMPSSTGVVDTFGFNAADQLTSIASAHGGTSIFSATYTRDGNAQVTSDTSATTNQTKYAYSALNQVCYAGSANTAACTSPPSGSQPFAYDAADNLTTIGSTAQAFNSGDQVTTSGSTTYQYDSHGNRTKATAGSTVTNYGYGQADRLCWSGPTSSGAGCTAAAQTSDTVYCYNGDGLRMLKVTAGSCVAPTTSEGFTWDVSSSLPLMLIDGSTDYVYGPGGLPLEQVNGTTTLWYHHDQIGSTRAITDSTGAAKATYKFDPYGNVTSCTGATVNVGGVNKCTGTITVSNPLLFSSQFRDAEINSYYLRARYYDPTSAQFLSRDPMFAATRSPYGYVSGNPLNSIDPSGLCDFLDVPCHVAEVAAAAAAAAKSAWDAVGGQAVSWAGDIRNALPNCTVFDGSSCQPILGAGGACFSGSIFAGIGAQGSICVASSHGQLGVTFTGGYGFGLGAGASFGPFASNASCLGDLGGPFADAGGGAGRFGGSIAGGQGINGPVIVASGGVGAGAEGFVGATNTVVWQP
jgi:RHS repeat-associated protein